MSDKTEVPRGLLKKDKSDVYIDLFLGNAWNKLRFFAT